MESTIALAALSALGHRMRLDAFRLLVQAGSEGMPAGAIAAALAVRPNSLSANLAILERAGLVQARREGRSIRYSADMDGMRRLLAFLMQDCCRGRPELCQPVLETLARPC